MIAFFAFTISIFAAAAVADAGMVAPRSKCASQMDITAPENAQEDAMRCLINHARRHAGVGGVRSDRSLERAAGRKSRDVLECGFSHTACGIPADHYAQRYGYTSGSFRWGENLAWGRGMDGSPRAVLQAWLNSPPHRATMLDGSYDDVGIGVRRGAFNGQRNTGVWVLEIGCHC